MRGILYKNEDNQWYIKHTFCPWEDYVVYNREYQLHPDDVNELIELDQIYPEREFEIIKNMDGDIEYAKII